MRRRVATASKQQAVLEHDLRTVLDFDDISAHIVGRHNRVRKSSLENELEIFTKAISWFKY